MAHHQTVYGKNRHQPLMQMTPEKPFSFPIRVYYEDTDDGGVVYYANYFKFAERARTEWLRSLGFAQTSLRKTEGINIVVRRCEAEFLAPARLDDQLVIQTSLHELGKVRMTLRQAVKRDEQTLVTLTVELACIDLSGKPARWPKVLSDVIV